ncbi:MAG: response regulator [Acidobacteria bacterium]|nr:MAG: response regulator [Acidobacteriota bacterium]
MAEELDFDDPETVMREARVRFIEAFPGRVRSLTLLFDAMGSPDGEAAGSQATARRMTHQMAGIAGTLGFPSVSAKASDLEQLVVAASQGQTGVKANDISLALMKLSESFAADLAKPEPAWAKAPGRPAGPRVLVAEDDETQLRIVTTWLRAAGYQVSATGDGSDVFNRARLEHPALIILDIDLPGTDGHAICRKLKSSPELATTPVVFMTTRASMSDRLTGVALGADDYLIKPIDQSELILRLSLLLKTRATTTADEHNGLLTYEAFVLAAQERLRRDRAALALVRLPLGREAEVAGAIAGAARRSDLVAMFDAGHVVWLLAAATGEIAAARTADLEKSWPGLIGGAAESAAAGAKSLEALLAEADHQLNGARLGTAKPAAYSPLVLLADDDPSVMRIVDAQLKSAGYRTAMVFDGDAAAAAVAEKQPDLMVLDLMMPKRTGFDVLTEIANAAKRPRVIVLSARGREEDVTRAFGLGADDYMTKPFSPQELMARVARLVR